MPSRLKTIVLFACLITAPAYAQSTETPDTPESKTYYGQIQFVRLIPIENGGAKHSVLADLKKIARATCEAAGTRIKKRSSKIYDMQVYGRDVQYNASVECK